MQQTATMTDELQTRVSSYHPSDEVMQLVRNTPLVFAVGPTGAGKDTIQALLLQTNHYHRVITYTMRAPRSNKGVPEQNGVDYHFIDLQTASQMLQAGEFIEVTITHGKFYGTGAGELRKARTKGLICLTDIDVKGAGNFAAISPKVKAFFIVPPNYQEWMNRLKKRYGDDVDQPQSREDLARRMQTAKQEFIFALDKPYFHFVINDNINDCVAHIDRLARETTTPPPDDPARQIARQILERIP